jgi:superfamily II DNA or RNA helicase
MMMKNEKLIARPYQVDALDSIRNHYSRGEKRVLLHLATGAGKTFLFSMMLKKVYERGKYAILVVRGRALVDQASQRLMREEVPHGVIMAGHWNYKPTERIQVCSIDTIHRRKIKLEASMIVIDEAHMAASRSYRELIDMYPDAFFLSVTATPYVKAGLKHLADHVVHPISVEKLMEQGYLVRPRYFSFPTDINLDDVEIDKKTGDYNQVQLGEAVNKSATLCGDIVTHWLKHARGRPTIAFAVNVRHSKAIANRFKDAGIQAEHIDADTPEDERRWVLQGLREGKIKVVSNVGILCTGVDIPEVSALILARPTQSKNLFIQQVGRGSRPYNNKSDFVVLDHATNVMKHGPIEDEEPCQLEGHGKVPKIKGSMTKCPKCFCVFDKKIYGKSCPGIILDDNGDEKPCGFEFIEIVDSVEPTEKSSGVINDTSKILVEITQPKDFFSSRLRQDLDRLITIAIEKNYKPGYVWHKIKDSHGLTKANQCRGEIQRRLGLFRQLDSNAIAETLKKVKAGLRGNS